MLTTSARPACLLWNTEARPRVCSPHIIPVVRMRLAKLGIRKSEVAAVLDNNVRALLSNQGSPQVI